MPIRTLLAPEGASTSGGAAAPAAPVTPATPANAPGQAAAKPAGDVKPAEAAKPEGDKAPPSSDAWAALAKREKALTEQQQKKAAEFAAKEKAVVEREARAKEIAETLEKSKEDPDKLLALAGWDYERLAKHKLGVAKTPEQIKADEAKALAEKIAKLEADRAADREALEKAQQAQQERERQANALAFKRTIGDYVQSKAAEFEVLLASGENIAEKAYSSIERVYQKTLAEVQAGKRAEPVIPDFKEMLAYMEKAERARLEKIAATQFFKAKYAPVAAKPADAKLGEGKPAGNAQRTLVVDGERIPIPSDEANRKSGRSREQAQKDALRILTEGVSSEQTPGVVGGNSRKAKFDEALAILNKGS